MSPQEVAQINRGPELVAGPTMRIASITVWRHELRLARPYRLSGGRLSFSRLDATILRIDTDSGLSGWGEGTPWGHTYLPAHGPGVRAGIETLAPAVLGLDPRRVEHVERTMDLCLPGHLYAKQPIDMACWDILGQAVGMAVADLLGGRYPDPAPLVSSVPTGTPEEMVAGIRRFRTRGTRRHSVKIGADPAADIARIRAIEAAREPDERILYDVNRAWTRAGALAVMNAVRDLAVTFEQPVETLDDLAAIRPLTTHAISVDERLETYADAVRIASEGLAEVFNIKLNRVGGLTKARRIRDLALAHGIPVYVMPTGGSVLADTEAAHLAQSVPPEMLLGTWTCQDMLADDPFAGTGALADGGVMRAPDAPGLGVAPDAAALGDPVAVYEV